MFGFNPYLILGGIGAILASFTFGLWKGYSYEHEKFMEFKNKTELIAKEQQAKIDSIVKQNTLVNEGIKNEYEAKMAAIRNYYAYWVRDNAGSGKLSPIPGTPKGVDAATANAIFAGQCAETTVQLTSLQEWIKLQVGIHAK
jgi:hypothetical protein